MKRLSWIATLCGTTMLFHAPWAAAQQNFCAGCHFANPDAPAAWHVANWDRSVHGSSRIGCDRCHGGNANTGESFQAHQGVLNSHNPASPVNSRNLAATCGSCHTGQFVEFQKSRHYSLLKSGETNGPNCDTCHGDVGDRLPSAKALEGQCTACHGAGKRVPRSGYASQASSLFEDISETRRLLRTAKTVIARVTDRQLRAKYEQAYEQAEVPLIQVVHAAHSFSFDDGLRKLLGVSRQRIDTLLAQLVNPPHG